MTWHRVACAAAPCLFAKSFALAVDLDQGVEAGRLWAGLRRTLPAARATGPYHFRLLALSIDRLLLRTDPSCRAVEVEARKTQVQLPAKKP